MPRKKQDSTDLNDYYTVEQAVKRLSENSGRQIDENYPRTLVKYGKVRSIDVGRTKLYLKEDIDRYKVSQKRGPRPRNQKNGDDSQEERQKPYAMAI